MKACGTVTLTKEVALQGVEVKASITGIGQASTIENRSTWQRHLCWPRNKETDENGSQDSCDYDDDDESGFGIDTGPYL